MTIPMLSDRAISPTCFPPEHGDSSRLYVDSSTKTLPQEHSFAVLSHSGPSSYSTTTPPFSSVTESIEHRPSSPLQNLITTSITPFSSSRPSSPLFPSLGASPSSSSPTYGCYSPNTSPYPTPSNTPRPSICNPDSGYSELERSTSPLADDQTSSSVMLKIQTTRRKSVADILQAVKTALDSICPQVNYECSETSFRLNGHCDLQMELEVCSETDGHVPGLQVRKLSGDNLEYAKLCSHLMACVNN